MEMDKKMVMTPQDMVALQNAANPEGLPDDVKQGAPWEELVVGENSVFEQYYNRKLQEYDEARERIEKKVEDITTSNAIGANNENIVIGGGGEDYESEEFVSEYSSGVGEGVTTEIIAEKVVDNLF